MQLESERDLFVILMYGASIYLKVLMFVRKQKKTLSWQNVNIHAIGIDRI